MLIRASRFISFVSKNIRLLDGVRRFLHQERQHQKIAARQSRFHHQKIVFIISLFHRHAARA